MGGGGRGRGLVDEHYVTLGEGMYLPALGSVTRVWGVSSFPGKKRYATLERPLSCTTVAGEWGTSQLSRYYD